MADPQLINDDLRPTTDAERTWSKWHIAALWVGMAVCIPTYLLAGWIMAGGASLGMAVLAIAIGNLIVLGPLILNAHPGTKYGIPFPVVLRSSFGIMGANIPAMMRAIVACGWFGFNTFIGGKAMYVLALIVVPGSWSMPEVLPDFMGIKTGMFLCYLAFWGIQVAIIVRGMESIRKLEALAAPFLILIGVALFGWAWVKTGSLSDMMASPPEAKQSATATLIVGINYAVAFWGTLALNIPDFARYAKSQRDQIVGQAIALPPTMTLYAFIGAAVTNATLVLYGQAIPDPVDLTARISSETSVIVALVSMFALGLATVSTNLAANIVSPANDISNLSPSRVSFQEGAIIATIVGSLFFPWKLADKIGNWLGAYGAVLGAVGGVMIADYYLIRKTQLVVDELYERGGRYEYKRGFNPVALCALAIGVGVNLPGMLQTMGFITAPSFFMSLYSWGWFVSFFVAGASHFIGTKLFASESA
ncbi:MAG: NCS1 family nucleobase:cation symporter-1 [Myxococcales bacterium]|nr:NCS1 family nucleobase:cation symporter-1 [Myxococcales bacterium]